MKPFNFIEAGYKVGDRVFSGASGWGKITGKNVDPDFPLGVTFENDTEDDFTATGLRYLTDTMPTLFPNEFAIPDSAYQRPRPNLKIDDRVLVNNAFPIEWVRGHFAGWTDDGYIKTFLDGLTSWTTDGATCVWTEWKLPDADPEKSEVKNDE